MKFLTALVLLMVPAVLGGSLKSLFAEIEEDLKENMFREEKDDQPDEDWGDKKDWGEMKGWGDKKSWRDHKSRGWENRRQVSGQNITKYFHHTENNIA
ncbi:hypothetical protein BgiBS90_003288 [Biomphalaria glabrata]|nr:hypothetical protein BgiBS90_003288 [Biomphalaria glabrata]